MSDVIITSRGSLTIEFNKGISVPIKYLEAGSDKNNTERRLTESVESVDS